MNYRKKKKLLPLGAIILLPEIGALSMIVGKRKNSFIIMNSFHKDSGEIISGDLSTKKWSLATKKQKELYFHFLYNHAHGL